MSETIKGLAHDPILALRMYVLGKAMDDPDIIAGLSHPETSEGGAWSETKFINNNHAYHISLDPIAHYEPDHSEADVACLALYKEDKEELFVLKAGGEIDHVKPESKEPVDLNAIDAGLQLTRLRTLFKDGNSLTPDNQV